MDPIQAYIEKLELDTIFAEYIDTFLILEQQMSRLGDNLAKLIDNIKNPKE